MKYSLMTCVGVFSLACSVAYASNNPGQSPNQTVPGAGQNNGNIFVPPDCATGFSKGNVSGSPQGQSYSYTCSTPKIVCPNPPATPAGQTQKWQGGLTTPKAVTSGKGAVFSYVCSYDIPPPPPK